MKLSDIEKTNSIKLNNRMRDQLGWNLNLDAMTTDSASAMMESIDNKLNAVRASHKIHASEKDPNYMGMLMAKQVLENYVAEANAKPDYLDFDKDGDTKEPMKKALKDKAKKKIGEAELKVNDEIDEKVDEPYAVGIAAAKKAAGYGSKPAHNLPKKVIKKGHEIAKKIAAEESVEVTEKWGTATKVSPSEKGKHSDKSVAELRSQLAKLKKSGPHKKGSKEYGTMRELQFAIRAKTGWGKVNESRLFEDELSQAQAMLAAKDMVDSMQDMIEEISKMLNEQLPPLTDSIRAAIGSAEADSFKASASSTLNTLLQAAQSGRESMDQSVRTLSGEPANVTVPSADVTEPMSTDTDTEMSDMEDDFGASDAAVGGELPLGREKR